MIANYDSIKLLVERNIFDDPLEIWLPELQKIWLEIYNTYVTPSEIVEIRLGTFTFFYDLANALHADSSDDMQSSRVVVAFGKTAPPIALRDTARMADFLGPTEHVYGPGFDKGHFIAHASGGDVLDSINWFSQERRLNRGWSPAGKRYRAMEKHCARITGTFCFSRPLYEDATDLPSSIEFGYLDGRDLVCETFDNRAEKIASFKPS